MPSAAKVLVQVLIHIIFLASNFNTFFFFSSPSLLHALFLWVSKTCTLLECIRLKYDSQIRYFFFLFLTTFIALLIHLSTTIYRMNYGLWFLYFHELTSFDYSLGKWVRIMLQQSCNTIPLFTYATLLLFFVLGMSNYRIIHVFTTYFLLYLFFWVSVICPPSLYFFFSNKFWYVRVFEGRPLSHAYAKLGKNFWQCDQFASAPPLQKKKKKTI